ncbi:selenide, water dikinase SelD [Rubritalea profundi]|uniref:Selenide, water dikinase SelD n=1 Tax=Rubritalea profundi TaxID=1658618 RepID=A0A2S7U6C8_9BACT|nr:selenide, water dikinase SelD [Rubritalea profundi]
MSGLPQNIDPNLLVGSATADDAGVYKIDEDRALVQTLDFFTPIVDDPYLFGQIAAANSLSDVYAMGGRPITAMAIAGMPTELLSNDEIAEIFRGGADMVKLANCSLVGGHTIKNPEPIYGLSVTGMVHPDNFLANAHAKEGDILLLTKPLGTGIISTALKQGACSDELNQVSITAMITLNTAGAELGEQDIVNACTDVTGFGLLGHLREIADASNLTAIVETKNIPAIADSIYDLIEAGLVPGGSKKNLESVSPSVTFSDSVSTASRLLMADAQTSGGLLLSVTPSNVPAVVKILEAHNSLCVAEIGTIVKRQNSSIVCQ